jgi:hypothetical protein
MHTGSWLILFLRGSSGEEVYILYKFTVPMNIWGEFVAKQLQ